MEKLICTGCGEEYNYDINLKVCIKCGCGLTFQFKDLDKLNFSKDWRGIWRFSIILPHVDEEYRISLGEGNTFIHHSRRIGLDLGLDLWFKDETIEPTGSYLDRSSALFTSKILSMNIKELTIYSKGNLSSSLAAYMAKASIKLKVYFNKTMDIGKLYQIIAYGAEIQSIIEPLKGVKIQEVEYDPLINEAKKTIAWEIILQLNPPPEYIILPMGTGGLAYNTYKALMEAKKLRVLKEIPKIIGVQSKGCAPIVKAFEENSRNIEVEYIETSIHDLNHPKPKYGLAALKAIKETNGLAIAVEEGEVKQALKDLARFEGILAEPAASLTIAGLRNLVKEGIIEKNSRIVCIITGSGLKDPKILREIAIQSPRIGGLIKGINGSIIGDMKFMIMRILFEGENYGYGIWRKLKDYYGVEIKMPTLYQHLKELLKEGYIKKSKTMKVMGRIREYYTLTDKGRLII
ncbi:MAG: pyridoxal-phosphate dependent enzyme [Candidatus Methanomethylicia archaeon]|nr:pyridoxal-phosphate dependent enzyme [Candidatus Methanomethylicia archaeon]